MNGNRKAPVAEPQPHPPGESPVRVELPEGVVVRPARPRDAGSFLEAGVPAVEFGPVGGGHHGPNEYVVTSSLETYRQMIVQFVQIVGRNGKVL